MLFFFFKQKSAYEMRISDWSSDVCSSDLARRAAAAAQARLRDRFARYFPPAAAQARGGALARRADRRTAGRAGADRKSVVEGKSVSVRVDLGGRRIIKKKNDNKFHNHQYNWCKYTT